MPAHPNAVLRWFDRPACDRIFFAVFPEPGAAQRAVEIGEGIRRQRGLTAKPFEADRLHVSLHWLGDYDGVPPGIVAKAKDAASKVAIAAFSVTFDRLGSFGREGEGHHPLVLTGSRELVALTHLYLSLKAALAASRLAAARRPACAGRQHSSHILDGAGVSSDSQSGGRPSLQGDGALAVGG